MAEVEKEPTIKKANFMKCRPSKRLVEEEVKMKMSSTTSKVGFVGWRSPPKDWGSWVNKLRSVHQFTWKNAGIYEAIMCSTYPIKRHDDLILDLASRWCSRTNTFVFPWGEATLTLEDMLVLGGFSASGVSALSSLENDVKSLMIEERLDVVRLEIQRSKQASRASQGKWMKKFIGSGSDLEHAAFLSLWLSRFVFPSETCSNSIINKHVLPVAARLSRGIKIALGPVVLAMLYKDLTALAKRLRFTQLIAEVAQSGDEPGQLKLYALFHLVQTWAWERFPMLKPVPNCMYSGENCPRLARWSNVKILKDKDLRSAIDSAEKAFLWCPYGVFSKRHGRDLETSELPGFDSSIERYHPQRVAKQFGLDQDILSDNIDKMTGPCSQVKVENAVDCSPPRFSHQIEVIDVVDSDSDDDCCLTVTKLLKLPIFETSSERPSPFSIASPDVAKEDTFFVGKTEDSDRVEKHQIFPLTSAQIKMEDEDGDRNNGLELVQLQHSDLVSPPADKDTNEAMDFVNGSVHETREDGDERSVHDSESYTNERSKDPDLDLEARISRLENLVYPHIEALEAARQH